MYSYKEALVIYGSRHALRKAVEDGRVVSLGRDRYCDAADVGLDHSLQELARHKGVVVTGHTAYYLLGMTDLEPDGVDIASKRGGTKITAGNLKQHFIPSDWLALGKSSISYEGLELPVYDKERMLLELMRNRNKMPYDLYKEIVQAYRRRTDEIDMRKLESYAKEMPRGASYLRRILSEVF